MKLFAAGLLALLLPSLALADVVRLKDGTKLEGEVKKDGDGWSITRNGATSHLRGDQVEAIELGGAPADNSPLAAAGRLASVRRAADSQTDLQKIIDLYTRFLSVNTDAKAGEDAKQDLDGWKAKLEQGMVKVGSRWVTSDERDQLAQQSQALADQARQLVKDGRLKDADAIIQQALANDPTNPSGTYLQGLLAYKQEQVPAARKAFAATVAVVPDHGPSLNNLAVVEFRQRDYSSALQHYDAAMLASTINKDVIDNVAAALHSLPDEKARGALFDRVSRHFQEQDKQLAEQQSQKGMVRWGSTWLGQAEYAQVLETQKQIQTKLDSLATDFDTTKAQISHIDQQMADTASSMHQMEATSYVIDPTTGQVSRGGVLPPVYFDLQRDYDRQSRQRDTAVQHLDDLQQQAKALQGKLPKPSYASVQQMIGAEGAPVRVAKTAASN